MTKIDIVSGFLGAGKTTLIQKLLKEALQDTKVVLIENEFGEIGIDGGFLKDAGIEIKEMNSGCICCSLVGDFGTSLKEVLATYKPERILIEPSGVGKLSDVIKAVEDVKSDVEVQLNSGVAVVDATKCKMYMKNFGEFFLNQIAYAGTIILSRTDKMTEDKLAACVAMIREHNAKATIITTPWDKLEGVKIMEAIEGSHKLEDTLMQEVLDHHHECNDHECHHDHDHHHDHECHHDHDHHHDHECHHDHDHHHDHECHHDHDHHHDHECCHDHHHEEHGEGCTCGCHDHHEENSTCGCKDHHHEGHHHADEVFTSWGMETPALYKKEELEQILTKIEDEQTYGFVLRAKGMVPAPDGTWIYFDYVPGEADIREGKPEVTGKFCVIGSQLKEENLKQLFHK